MLADGVLPATRHREPWSCSATAEHTSVRLAQDLGPWLLYEFMSEETNIPSLGRYVPAFSIGKAHEPGHPASVRKAVR